MSDKDKVRAAEALDHLRAACERAGHAACERAGRAADIAARHTLLAITDFAAIHALHNRMAALHRRTELRHSVTADLRTRNLVTASGADLCERWRLYGPAVTSLGVRMVAAVPLQAGTVCLGALTLLNPGPWQVGAIIDLLGEALTHSLLDGSPDDCLPAACLPARGDHRPAEHAAAGVISARHGCSVDDALALIRARAFADGSDARTVARDILRGRCSLGLAGED